MDETLLIAAFCLLLAVLALVIAVKVIVPLESFGSAEEFETSPAKEDKANQAKEDKDPASIPTSAAVTDEQERTTQITMTNIQFKQASFLTKSELKAKPSASVSLTDHLFAHRHFVAYMSSLSKRDLLTKLGLTPSRVDLSLDDLYTMYKAQVKPYMAKEDLDVLQKYCNVVDAIFVHHGLKNLTGFPWKILASVGDLEWNMPYTVADVIVVPQSILNHVRDFHQFHDNPKHSKISSRSSRLTKKFKETIAGKDIVDSHAYVESFINAMLHERIHVIQRAHQDKFNLWYGKLFPFMIPLETVSDKTRAVPANIYTENPDANFVIWRYSVLPDANVDVNSNIMQLITPFVGIGVPGKTSPAAHFVNWPYTKASVPRRLDDPEVHWRELLPVHISKLGGVENAYHPNEIVATWMAVELIDTANEPTKDLIDFFKEL